MTDESNDSIPRTKKEIENELERITVLWKEAADENSRTKSEWSGALAEVRSGYRDALSWVLKVGEFTE